MKLGGKVAIVTGSSQGIGRAIAMLIAREGAVVVINGTDPERIEAVVEEIKGQGGSAFPFKANVARRIEVQELCKTVIKTFEFVHILVNNAGITRHAPLVELTEEDWDLVLDVDLKSVFLCMQAVAPVMIRQRYGKIINISSLSGMGAAGIGQANYAAAKAGVIQLSKVAARELGPHGINVNCIAPGVIVTPSQYTRRGQHGAESFFEKKRRASVLDRVGTPEDIANLTLFLASDESHFITGQVIACEGGRTDLMVN